MRKKITFLRASSCSMVLFGVMIFIHILSNVAHAVGTVDLPSTSQTTCYNAVGTKIDCAGTGQDGDTRTGLEWTQPRFTNNSDGTLTDNLTGLIWLQDANCKDTAGGINRDNGFNGGLYWNDALTWSNNLATGICGLTDGSNAGDWRLPNILELQILVNIDYGNELCGGIACTSPAAWLTTQSFSNMSTGTYFSSSTAIQDGHHDDAWIVAMSNGNMGHGGKDSYYNLVAVRGTSTGPAKVWKTGQTTCYDINGTSVACPGTGQDGDLLNGATWPEPRFTDNNDGTVTDNLSGLIWLKNANCTNGARDWQTALDDVAGLNTAGTMNGNNCGDTSNAGSHQTDWRLPNYKELLSLIDFSHYSPALPASYPFSNLVTWGDLWSSTTASASTQGALEIYMWDGYINATAKTSTNYVWPVRGGILPSPFAGGDGSEDNPYQIETAAQLDAVRGYLTAHFILVADINLDVAPYNEGEGWEPIGTSDAPFTGGFDGKGHSIVNLLINRSDQDYIGLFGNASNAQFSNLSLQVNITGKSQVGGLVGNLEPGAIMAVHIHGSVIGTGHTVGGLAGRIREVPISSSHTIAVVSGGSETYGGGADIGGLVGNVQNDSSIGDCSAQGSTSGTAFRIGGLAGDLWASTLHNSYATGNVLGRENVGGLIGLNGMSTISVAYATGDVTTTSNGINNFGGLVGTSDSGASITDSFSTGDVNGVDNVGGLIGRQTADSNVSKSYATGHVIGTTSNIGGLIGINYGGAVTASYYNSETSGQSDTGNGEPRTTAQMRAGMAYAADVTYVDWFETVTPWSIGTGFNGGYPYLIALPRFMISTSISGNGSASWAGEYPHGSKAELLLTPDSGWRIGSATGCNGALTGNLYTTVSLTDNCTVVIIFDKKFPWNLFIPAIISSNSVKGN